MFHASLHVHSNVASSSNTINTVLCVHHTNLTFQHRNNSHIYHFHLRLFNPNVHIVCIHARKLFFVSIWTMDAPFCAQPHYRRISWNHNKLILIVVALQFPSYTFIHQSPGHNCITILEHSKNDILVHRAWIPKTIHAYFNVALHHWHRL